MMLYLIFMVPSLLLSLWAQNKVQGSYKKYSDEPIALGLTGAQAARQVLNAHGLHNVGVERSDKPGLSDHYDPQSRVLRLSQGVYGVPSIAAVGIAAHEAGHAIQHAQGYGPLMLRTNMVPIVTLGSRFSFILLFAGLFMQLTGLAWAGVALFGLTTVFALMTLPVEFDASKRAKVALVQAGIVDGGVANGQENRGVDDVLDAAAWTYIAGFIASLSTLLYYVMIVSGMNRSND